MKSARMLSENYEKNSVKIFYKGDKNAANKTFQKTGKRSLSYQAAEYVFSKDREWITHASVHDTDVKSGKQS